TLLVLTIATSALSVAADAPPGASPPASSRAPVPLPDWSGWWYLDLAAEETPGTRYFTKAPFKPEIAAKMKGGLPAPVKGRNDKQLFCLPLRFYGFSGGFVEDVEFIFTPGRVTLLNESGLLRRIFTDGTQPDEIDETNNGLSVGHWE